MDEYRLDTLPNGVRIVTQNIDVLRSASLGIWVGTGSRHETPSQGGWAHFIEHMVFKGTQRRTAQQLAQEMDAIGGQVNAFTSKETTCFYARSLDDHLDRTTDILCDMVFESKFEEKDVETERGVILEEISMYQDDPQDLCDQRLLAAIYKGTPLGRPILGTKQSLSKVTSEGLKAYMQDHYRAGDIVISLAGSFRESVVDEIKHRFSALPEGKYPRPKACSYRPAITLKRKATEQNHITMAFPALPYGHPMRFALQLMSTILGSGMSARLWQEVRERQGLCYSIYTYGAGHVETGIFGIYTALSKDTEARAMQAIRQVVRTFLEEGPTDEEVDRAREQSKANVFMGLESTQARMSNMGRGVLFHGKPLTTQEVIDAYNGVTREHVLELAREIIDFSKLSLSVVGRTATEEEYRELLAP